MKRFIKKTGWLVMAAVLAFGTAACSSDDYAITEQPENPTEKTYTMTIQASKGDDATMRGLYFADGEKSKDLRVNWNGKEKIRVVQNGAVIGTLSAALSSTKSTTLTGTVTGFQVNQAIGFYLLADENGKMDYTGQKGAMLDDNGTGNIEENYDFASYELTGAECMEAFKIEGSTVVPKDGVYIPFTSQQAIVWFEFTYNNTPLYAKQLIVTDKNSGKLVQSIDTKTGIKTSSTKTYGPLSLTPVNNTAAGFYVALNLDGVSDIHLRVVDSNDKIYTCNKANVTFEKGKYYRVTAKMSSCSSLPLSQITPYDKNLVGWYLAKPLAGEAFAYDPTGISFPSAKDYGIIAYVGTVPGYFDNFLAMAMHDIKKDGSEEGREFMSWSEALTAIGSFATAHPIVIGSTTYNTASNTAYDEVDDNTASASNTSNSTRKGWRIPSVTDWRYIFYGLCGEPSPTNPAGITQGVDYSSSNLVKKLNDEQNADLSGRGWYCTSSAFSGANDRWMIQLVDIPKFERMSVTVCCLRPVFAY